MDRNKHIAKLMGFFITILAIAFVVAFDYGMHRYNSQGLNNGKNTINEEDDKTVAKAYSQEVVLEKTKIIQRTFYEFGEEGKNTKDQVVSFDKKYLGKNRSELNEIFKDKGYAVDTMSAAEVILVKHEKYPPNKYFITVNKDNKFTIGKCDENGVISYIDIASEMASQPKLKKLEELRAGDIDILKNGDKTLEFDKKEDAINYLYENYSS